MWPMCDYHHVVALRSFHIACRVPLGTQIAVVAAVASAVAFVVGAAVSGAPPPLCYCPSQLTAVLQAIPCNTSPSCETNLPFVFTQRYIIIFMQYKRYKY